MTKLKQPGKEQQRNGFTLIELLIVIGIIAILAGAVVIAISPGERLASARDATRERHVQAIEQAVLSYQVDNEGNFPETLENSLGSEICNTNLENPDCEDLIDLSTLTKEGYLSSLPLNPGKEEESQGIGYKIATVNHKLAVWPIESETRQVGTRPVLELFGENSYVQVGDPNSFEIQEGEDLTIAIWAKPGIVMRGGHRRDGLFSKATDNLGYGLVMHYNEDGIPTHFAFVVRCDVDGTRIASVDIDNYR